VGVSAARTYSTSATWSGDRSETSLTHATLVVGYNDGLDTHVLESDDCMKVMQLVLVEAEHKYCNETRWDVRDSLT
jgi:hypothetical protein